MVSITTRQIPDGTGKLSFLASWTHREAFQISSDEFDPNSPKNLITLGGRYRSDRGFLGSLYIHARSEFQDRRVTNPKGMLEPFISQHSDNVFLVRTSGAIDSGQICCAG